MGNEAAPSKDPGFNRFLGCPSPPYTLPVLPITMFDTVHTRGIVTWGPQNRTVHIANTATYCTGRVFVFVFGVRPLGFRSLNRLPQAP